MTDRIPAPNGVRVIRIIEYQYADLETAEKDMARWTNSLRNGPMTGGYTMVMRSAALPLEAFDWPEPRCYCGAIPLPADGYTVEIGGHRCRPCRGEGVVFASDEDTIGDACEHCDGTGFKASTRDAALAASDALDGADL